MRWPRQVRRSTPLFEQLQAILKGMRSHAEEVAQTSNQLSDSVGQLAGSVDRQNEATSSMAAGAEELAVSVAHVSEGALTAQINLPALASTR
jgi:methyl-accepting chemotaxis protein